MVYSINLWNVPICDMTYDEFLVHLKRIRITVGEFANMVKMNHKSLSNYSIKGEVPSHIAIIVILIAYMAEQQIDFRQVISSIEIKSKKPRGSRDWKVRRK